MLAPPLLTMSRPLVARALLLAVATVITIAVHAITTLARGDRRLDQPPSPTVNVQTLGVEELNEVVRWLDDFYRAPEGLARPAGLVLDGHIDQAAVAGWLHHYMESRAAGATPEEARASIAQAIQASLEWQGAHRATR
ncbi:MAG: hypothetical protein ABL961_00195 [Vicinamibacterales bacterium]